MLAPGDIVTAEVVSSQIYGVFCRYESYDMLVLIPETSWIASFNSCLQFAAPGDQLFVRIRFIDEATGKIGASVKDAHPNPWEAGSLLVGSTYNARIVRFVECADRCDDGPAYLIELLPGSYAMLPAKHRSAARDQIIEVQVLSTDHRNRAVVVDWVR